MSLHESEDADIYGGEDFTPPVVPLAVASNADIAPLAIDQSIQAGDKNKEKSIPVVNIRVSGLEWFTSDQLIEQRLSTIGGVVELNMQHFIENGKFNGIFEASIRTDEDDAKIIENVKSLDFGQKRAVNAIIVPNLAPINFNVNNTNNVNNNSVSTNMNNSNFNNFNNFNNYNNNYNNNNTNSNMNFNNKMNGFNNYNSYNGQQDQMYGNNMNMNMNINMNMNNGFNNNTGPIKKPKEAPMLYADMKNPIPKELLSNDFLDKFDNSNSMNGSSSKSDSKKKNSSSKTDRGDRDRDSKYGRDSRDSRDRDRRRDRDYDYYDYDYSYSYRSKRDDREDYYERSDRRRRDDDRDDRSHSSREKRRK